MRDVFGGVATALCIIFAVVTPRAVSDLDRITRSMETIAENTRQPIQLQIAGFSPEAQQALTSTLQSPKRKKQ
jgi:hypothetical protein